MRILHTSDWHLGRTLHKVSLAEAQEAAMWQIGQIAAQENVDLIVVAGDVFDHAIPSADALDLLERTLASLLDVAPVVVTAGNHDSLRRLGYGSSLFTAGLHMCTTVEQIDRPVVVDGVRVYPIPYLHPDGARVDLRPEDPLPATHHAVLTEAMDRVRADLAAHPRARSVVLAHAWVAGEGPATPNATSPWVAWGSCRQPCSTGWTTSHWVTCIVRRTSAVGLAPDCATAARHCGTRSARPTT